MPTTYISTEYIIAHLLIAFAKNNRMFITAKDLFAFEHYLWEETKTANINVVPLFSAIRLTNALWDFSDYFFYNKQKQITLAKDKTIADLEHRFCGFLPFEVLVFLDNASKDFAQNYIFEEAV